MPDAIDTPSWSDFQAARQRFLDGLAADAALTRLESAWRLPALGHEPEPHSSRRETTLPPGVEGQVT